MLVMCMGVYSASGQKPFFRNIKMPDEFQQTSISCLYQDDNRFMWIGTSKGLYQFNGTDFVFFPGPDKQTAMQVSSLFMTPDHVLWIGTRKGNIYQLENDSLHLFNPEEGNPKVAVTGFAMDKKGNLWFSTYGEGVYYYDGKHLHNFNTDDGLTDNSCYTVTADKKDRMWVATDEGISVCSLNKDKKIIHNINSSQGLPDNIVLSLTADLTGMWAGMQDAGICKVDLETFKILAPNASAKWAYGPVNNIVTGDGWLWLSTEQNGIISIETAAGNFNDKYTTADNLNISRISSLYSDKQGNYWIASGSQLFLSLGSNLLYFTVFDRTMGENINSVLADRKGNIWFSSEGQLFCLDTKSGKTNETKIPFKKHTHIISLYEDDIGYIWAGTFGNGLFCIDVEHKRTKLFSEPDGLSNGNILSITGKGEQMWLATLGGAYKCEIKGDPFHKGSQVEFINYGDQNFPGNNYIYSVFIDSHKRVWFATDGKGISMLQNGRVTNFDKADGLKSSIIYSVTEDSDGGIWFSTSNAGLYRFNGKSFLNYSLESGLSDINITGLVADKNHHLLIVHNNGMDVLDTRNNTFIYYTSGIGMLDINPDLNVCTIDNQHNAWIGTQNGLIRLQIPKDISGLQPSLQLKMITVFEGKKNHLGTEVFSYTENYLSFHFNALWYIAPALVKYQIKLEGYDRGWIDTRNNQVTYSNLPPGHYTFKVRSAIKGDFSASVVKSYTFSIEEPFWKTYWFIFLSVSVLALLVYSFLNFRLNALKQRDALAREKIIVQFQTLRSQVNPHFLFNSFSTLISIIDEDKQVAIEYVEKLSQFFRDILEYREKDLIPLSEELKLIDTYIYLQKKRYCENLQLHIGVSEASLSSLIPPMVLQMLVENAIKHNVVSVEKPLSVKIYTDKKHIFIANNLQPKKVNEPSTGIGLANIRNRYNLLGFGEITIDASGGSFIVKLPIISPEK